MREGGGGENMKITRSGFTSTALSTCRIPEFTLFWKDLLHNPEVLAPGFKGECIQGSVLP